MTRESTDRERRQGLLRKLVANARAIVTHQVGMPLGCVRADRILFWLKPMDGPDYPIFAEYLEAVSGLPISHERLDWEPRRLLEQDAILQQHNTVYRARILEACFDIIERHGNI